MNPTCKQYARVTHPVPTTIETIHRRLEVVIMFLMRFLLRPEMFPDFLVLLGQKDLVARMAVVETIELFQFTAGTI